MSCSKNTWSTVAEGDGTVYKLTDACAALFDCAVGSYCPAGSFSGRTPRPTNELTETHSQARKKTPRPTSPRPGGPAAAAASTARSSRATTRTSSRTSARAATASGAARTRRCPSSAPRATSARRPRRWRSARKAPTARRAPWRRPSARTSRTAPRGPRWPPDSEDTPHSPLWPCALAAQACPRARERIARSCVTHWPVSYQLLRSGEGTRALYGVRPQVEKYSGPAMRRRIDELSDSFFNQMPYTMVRADGVTLSWCRVEIPTTRECPPGADALRPKTRAAVRLRALAAGWLSAKA